MKALLLSLADVAPNSNFDLTTPFAIYLVILISAMLAFRRVLRRYKGLVVLKQWGIARHLLFIPTEETHEEF